MALCFFSGQRKTKKGITKAKVARTRRNKHALKGTGAGAVKAKKAQQSCAIAVRNIPLALTCEEWQRRAQLLFCLMCRDAASKAGQKMGKGSGKWH